MRPQRSTKAKMSVPSRSGKGRCCAWGSGRCTGSRQKRAASWSRWHTGILMKPISSVSKTTTVADMRSREPVSREEAFIALIVAVVIIARVASFAYFSSLAAGTPDANPYPVVAGDSVHYAQWGNNLLTLHAYQESPGEPLRAAPPGYPALLAA